MDGASQIVVPAFVSLLCICIVFMPMFFLSGVARFCSCRWPKRDVRDGLFVPAVAHAGADDGEISAAQARPHATITGVLSAPPSKNPLVRFQRGFEAASQRFAPGITICWRSRSSIAGLSSSGFLGFVAVSFLLAPFLGRNFFPQVDGGQILLHVRAPVGMRIEETAARFAESRRRSAR
jgi:multidrug efflux pump subunit AcrB